MEVENLLPPLPTLYKAKSNKYQMAQGLQEVPEKQVILQSQLPVLKITNFQKVRNQEIQLLKMSRDEADEHMFIKNQKKRLVYLKKLAQKLHFKDIADNCLSVLASDDSLSSQSSMDSPQHVKTLPYSSRRAMLQLPKVSEHSSERTDLRFS